MAQSQIPIGATAEAPRNVTTAILDHPALGTPDWTHLLLDALPDEIYVKDCAGRFVLVNTATARYFNTAPAAMVGHTDFDFLPASLAEQFFAEEQELFQSGQPLINRESRLVDPSGRARWVLTTKVALRDSEGTVVGLAGVNRDVTERKQAAEQLQQLNADLARSQVELLAVYENLKLTQTQLVQAEKLESIGRLAAGVAHEVKNPLAILLLGVGYFEDTVPVGTAATDGVLRDMRDAVERADVIVRDLLEFASPRDLETAVENLNAIVERALRLVRHELKSHGIIVVQEFAANLPARRIDRIRIEQVFVNLLMNAVQAMPQGGQLTVRTAAAGPDVVVEFLDTGVGIPAEAVPKIFDPFFTTKPIGVGSGMGLAVAKQILTQHAGELTLQNRATGGVQATVVFHNGKEH